MRSLLEDLDQNLVEARSGEEAVERVKADEFAVILLDVLMPGINGFETAKAIRNQVRSQHTPVIFLTAGDIDRSQMEEGYRARCGGLLGGAAAAVRPPSPRCVASFNSSRTSSGQHEADQLRLLVHGTTEYAIFMLDPQGRIVTWNAGAERIKGYKVDEIIDQPSRNFTHEAINRGWLPTN